jgi:hypothetical protein
VATIQIREEGMKKKMCSVMMLFLAATLFAWGFGCSAVTGSGGKKDVPRMSLDDLKSRLSDPSVVVIDVRQGGDWDGSSVKIKGAVREDPKNVPAWASKYSKDKTLVFYCA